MNLHKVNNNGQYDFSMKIDKFYSLLKKPQDFFNGLKRGQESDIGKNRGCYGAQTLKVQHFVLGHILTSLKSKNATIYFKPGVIESGTSCSSHIIHHVRCHVLPLLGIRFEKEYNPTLKASQSHLKISEWAIRHMLKSEGQPFYLKNRLLANHMQKLKPIDNRRSYQEVEETTDPPDQAKLVDEEIDGTR